MASPENELPVEPEVPPGLRVSEQEQERIDRLAETHGKHTAVQFVLPTERARRIIGHDFATDQVDAHAANIREREAREAAAKRTPDALELIKSTLPQTPQEEQEETQPPETNDEAA